MGTSARIRIAKQGEPDTFIIKYHDGFPDGVGNFLRQDLALLGIRAGTDLTTLEVALKLRDADDRRGAEGRAQFGLKPRAGQTGDMTIHRSEPGTWGDTKYLQPDGSTKAIFYPDRYEYHYRVRLDKADERPFRLVSVVGMQADAEVLTDLPEVIGSADL